MYFSIKLQAVLRGNFMIWRMTNDFFFEGNKLYDCKSFHKFFVCHVHFLFVCVHVGACMCVCMHMFVCLCTCVCACMLMCVCPCRWRMSIHISVLFLCACMRVFVYFNVYIKRIPVLFMFR